MSRRSRDWPPSQHLRNERMPFGERQTHLAIACEMAAMCDTKSTSTRVCRSYFRKNPAIDFNDWLSSRHRDMPYQTLLSQVLEPKPSAGMRLSIWVHLDAQCLYWTASTARTRSAINSPHRAVPESLYIKDGDVRLSAADWAPPGVPRPPVAARHQTHPALAPTDFDFRTGLLLARPHPQYLRVPH
ncbi:hypothetical protein FQR65_LT21006 [Abscondita terminalis]|nr:hypothetical protein FQR65_LT21006 [Abscondita terminalis]